MNELRHAFRQHLKSPGFTAIAVLTLSLGIGACALVFSWIRTVLLDTIPGARQPSRLVVLAERHVSGTIFDTLSLSDIRDLREATNLFAGIAGSQMEAATLRIDREPEWVWVQPATANFFDVLGITPVLGRGFLPGEDETARGNPVTVISHRLWQRRFGSDPGVIGRTVEIARRPFTIIGVAPAAFRGTMGGLGFDLWIPISMTSQHRDLAGALTRRDWRWIHTIARLRDGVTLAQARAGTDLAMRRLEAAYPDTNRDVGTTVLPLWKSPWGAQSSLLPLLTALAGVSGLLLLLVIANVANLLLARATSREGEMAVRVALGAGTGRLIRQVLIESLVLATLGGLLGTGFAALGSRMLLGLLPVTYLPIALEFPINASVLGFTALVTLGTGLLFGLVPAWRAAQAGLADTLKAGGRSGGSSRHSHRLRQTLVVTEVAAALVLLVGMTLCARSFEEARKLNVGFDPEHVWIAGFRLPPGAYSPEEYQAFYRRLRTELAGLPGVKAVGLADWLPLGFEGGSSTGFEVPGYQPTAGENVNAGTSIVGTGYFEAFAIAPTRGRVFDDRDRQGSTPAIIINEQLARRYFGGRDPIGLPLKLWGVTRTVVGVVPTGKYRTLNEAPRNYLYVPVEQIGHPTLAAVIRTEGAPETVASSVERVARALDPSVRPVAAMPMIQFMAAAYVVPRTAATLLTILGAIAVLLSSLGIYGVIAWSVSRRVREVGVRMALGASRREVAWMFIRQGLRLVGLGLAAGLVGAVLAGRALGSLLVNLSANDPVTYLLAVPLLVGIALLACWVPARRACAVEPIAALRTD